ncbi:hypothetical protein LINGRAHAP2_LOCUS30363 [Linum grandiflorum]
MVLKFGKTVSPENQGEEKGRNASGKKRKEMIGIRIRYKQRHGAV